MAPWLCDLSTKNRWNVVLVPIPKEDRLSVHAQMRVPLLDLSGRLTSGVVMEFNRTAWVARVFVDEA